MRANKNVGSQENHKKEMSITLSDIEVQVLGKLGDPEKIVRGLISEAVQGKIRELGDKELWDMYYENFSKTK